jgi:hypothetical protein
MLPEVDCYGSPLFHGPNRAKHLGMRFTPNMTSNYRYHIGNFDADSVSRRMQGAKVRVVHWIGSDVVKAVRKGRCYRDAIHWCVWHNLKEELTTIGIKAEVYVHRPLHYFGEPLPPGGDGVAVYAPTKAYYPDIIERVCEKLDKEGRKVYKLPTPNFPRVVVPIDEVFRECSHYLRLVKHDGFSQLSIEFMLAGRQVVTNQDRPFQMQVQEQDIDEIMAALDVKHPRWSVLDAREVPKFYRELTNPQHIIRRWKELIDAV